MRWLSPFPPIELSLALPVKATVATSIRSSSFGCQRSAASKIYVTMLACLAEKSGRNMGPLLTRRGEKRFGTIVAIMNKPLTQRAIEGATQSAWLRLGLKRNARKGKRMKIFRTMLVVLATTTGVGTVKTARADHDENYSNITKHAEAIICATDELRDELHYRFHDSRLYGELLSTNARIHGKAIALRAQSRARSCGRSSDRIVCDLFELVCRLDEGIRAALRTDCRIGSPRRAEMKVARMREAIRCIQREMSIVGASLEEVAPGYPGGLGYGGGSWTGHSSAYNPGTGYGSGNGNGFDRRSSGGYSTLTRGSMSSFPSSENGRRNLGGQSYGRGVSLDRNGLTLNTGGFSVHLNR